MCWFGLIRKKSERGNFKMQNTCCPLVSQKYMVGLLIFIQLISSGSCIIATKVCMIVYTSLCILKSLNTKMDLNCIKSY